ncbi:phospholipase A2 inhibitor and Ly6/PLAUR domain-containing protein-like [Anomaloglossus baeobatrachus]|uniref:phospholipase A2 inhibitor and Ly6/PLAUR domain-containing protein-like n=1 Tax=Anomaloglossus baeobatrachus TaxID=238106 RepID=UPI003F50CB54
MKNLVALLCMMSALVLSALSYKCYSSLCRKSTTCDGSEDECFGDRCMTMSQHLYLGEDGRDIKSILKGCANETVCRMKGSSNAKNFTFRNYVKCCDGNLCNTDDYDIPEEDPTPNGVKCPSAYCTGTVEECESNEEMDCTGSMDHCFDYREHVVDAGERDEKYSIKGCANSDACRYSFDNDVGFNVVEKKYGKCYDPSKSNNLQ